MTRPGRKREIENVRVQGAEAFELGRSRDTNPYKHSSNFHHWQAGWDGAQWQAERNAEDDARYKKASRFNAIRSDLRCGLYPAALDKIVDLLEELAA